MKYRTGGGGNSEVLEKSAKVTLFICGGLWLWAVGNLLWNYFFVAKDPSLFSLLLSLVVGSVIWFFLCKLFIQFAAIFVVTPFVWLFGKLTGAADERPAPNALTSEEFLYLGQSTGTLAAKNHTRGLSPGQPVFLSVPDCCQNLICFGGIGSGKTTRVITPALIQLFKKKTGGLIFDIKGDFGRTVADVADYAGRDFVTVGVADEDLGLNLIQGISPELAASYLKSVFRLEGGGRGDDAFWVDNATLLCQNALGLLKLAKKYDLYSLYRFVFFPGFRDEVFAAAETAAMEQARDKAYFDGCRDYYHEVFDKFDDKVKQSIKATVSQVLSGFQNPALIDAFCSENKPQVKIEDCLAGQIVLVNLPIAEWGNPAKAVYTLVKLRFFSLVQQRATRTDNFQDNPVFFMCDEYQDIISANKSGLSDLNFWDKSRSAKCIGIVSSQSINSFRAAVGDRQTADTILQNFRQKICFRTEDTETIRYFQDLAGRSEVWRTSESKGDSRTGGWTGTDTASKGESRSLQERNVVDSQLVRSLQENTGLCFLNLGGGSFDDVLVFTPSFDVLRKR